MLRLADVGVRYGHVQALAGVTLTVPRDAIFAVLGANGAGKTTLLRSIMGLVPPPGSLEFDGQSLATVPTFERVRRGLALVPEGRRLFPRFTVEENLRAGAFHRAARDDVRRDLDRISETFPVLRARSRQLAGTLSGGEGQMLAIARALMARPRLLLLDEPSVGLMPLAVSEIFAMIGDVPRHGTTVLLVEQNARMALRVARRVAVLELGRVVLEGDVADLREDPRVKEAYLGG